jgi:preprotein translocase subunit SecB
VQNSPLQLEEYLLRELMFSLTDELREIPAKSVNYDGMNIDINADVAMRDDDSRKWRCELTIASKTQEGLNHPYKFRITFVGFFRVIDEFPVERVETMARTNAPAVLYSAAREALLSVSGRGRYPAILLPSITFIEPPKAEAKAAKGQKGQEAASSQKSKKKAARKKAAK